jgi:uncharacterized membrane protein YgdD (TMEM256/DUF423 family)
MTRSFFMLIAGLMGAAGVALAAAAAHAAPGVGLDSAAQILMVHAVALVGGAAAVSAGLTWRPIALAALIGFALGALIFSGDITLRAFVGNRLFPMAAPTGGSILILSWLMLAVAAAVRLFRGA